MAGAGKNRDLTRIAGYVRIKGKQEKKNSSTRTFRQGELMSPRKSAIVFLLALVAGLSLAGSAAAVQRCVLLELFTSCG
jgi:hypothetical protein